MDECKPLLHGAGVLHRDLKPENVRVDATLRVPRLIDLGLAVHVRQAAAYTRPVFSST